MFKIQLKPDLNPDQEVVDIQEVMTRPIEEMTGREKVIDMKEAQKDLNPGPDQEVEDLPENIRLPDDRLPAAAVGPDIEENQENVEIQENVVLREVLPEDPIPHKDKKVQKVENDRNKKHFNFYLIYI